MFEFNNQDVIDRTMTSQLAEIEPLYWILEDSIYSGDKDKAKAVFSLLLYTAKFRPDLISSGLKPKQRERMKEICHEMSDNPILKETNPITIKFATEPKRLPFTKECELQQFLFDNPNVLSSALNDTIRVVGIEVETDCGYKCDIVAEGQKFFYPIELKIGQANHSIVSQIDKYLYFFYRKLRYNHYKELQGIAISNGYCQWSINELRRRKIWVFDVFPDGNGIKLVKID